MPDAREITWRMQFRGCYSHCERMCLRADRTVPSDAYGRSVLQLELMKANNSFRKCQFMTWAEFEEWKRGFPETDPYVDGRATPADGGISADEGMLQWVLKNNCAVM